MSDPEFLDLPPADTSRIDEIWAWIAVHQGGGEGIMAGGVEGVGWVPLVTSDADLARKLRSVAREAQRVGARQGDRLVKIELRRYVLDSRAEG